MPNTFHFLLLGRQLDRFEENSETVKNFTTISEIKTFHFMKEDGRNTG
jgi:hypothetical protein